LPRATPPGTNIFIDQKKSIDNLMTKEEKDNNKEEENQQYIRRLLDSEAETRAEPAIEPKPDETCESGWYYACQPTAENTCIRP
jgi:hypothetical protein